MAAGARQRLARFLKLALPLSAGGIVAVIFTFPRPEFIRDAGFDDFDFDLSEGLRLANPRFSGATPDGRPFEVRAEWALPDGPNPASVRLGPVTGQIRLDDRRAVNLMAGGGEIRPKEERLRLDGSVAVETSDGYRMTASAATVEIGGNRLSATGPVSGAGPGGSIDAASMRAARTDDGDFIWFEGGVRVRIDPAQAKGDPE